MSKFYRLMGVEAKFDADHHFSTSWLLPPLYLACLRALIAVYAFVVIIAVLCHDGTLPGPSEAERSFSYFTNLTYWGIAFYFVCSAVHTLTYVRYGSALLERWPRPLQAMHSVFYTTIITFPFLVTLVFWIVLYDGTWFSIEFNAWSNVSQHGLNTLFAVLELTLPATNPPPQLHLAFLIVILLLYLALAYVTYATQGFYTYNFLDPANGKGKVTGYVCGIAAGIVFIFELACGGIWMRRKYTRPGKRRKENLVRRTPEEDIDVVEQTTKDGA